MTTNSLSPTERVMALFGNLFGWKGNMSGRSIATYHPFCELLPYRDLIQQMIVDRYGCLHALYEIDALEIGVASTDLLIQLQNSLVAATDKLPERVVQLEYHFTTNGDLAPVIEAHGNYESDWELTDWLRKNRRQRLREKMQRRELVQSNTILVVTVRPPDQPSHRPIDLLSKNSPSPDRLLPRPLSHEEFQDAVQLHQIALSTLSDTLGRVGIRLRAMNDREISGYFYRLMNPDLAVEQGIPLHFDPDSTPFLDSWLCHEIELHDRSFRWGNYHHGMISMVAKPIESRPAEIAQLTTSLPFSDTRITLKVRRLDKQQEMESLRMKQMLAFDKSQKSPHVIDQFMTPYQKESSNPSMHYEAQEQMEEANELLRLMRSGHESLVQIQLTAHTWHRDPQELQKRREILMGRIAGWNRARPWLDTFSTLPVFCNSLPAVYEPFERPLKVKSHMMADLVPLSKGFEGGDPPLALLRNSSQGLISLNLWHLKETSAPLAFVSGETGSGKSVLILYLLLQHLAHDKPTENDPILLMLDVGGSYRPLIELAGGDYIPLDFQNPILFNPLQVYRFNDRHSSEPTLEERSMILDQLIPILSSPSDPEGELPTPLKNLLNTALELTFNVAAKRQIRCVILDHLFEQLGKMGADTDPLIERLRPFVTGGELAGWFNGPTQIHLESRAICFDLKGVQQHPTLARSLIPMIINLYKSMIWANRSERKILVLDELWQFLETPALADFIREAWKTFRKENTAIIGGSQSLADLTKLPAIADAILQGTQTWFLLPQGNSDNNRVAAEFLSLTEGQIELLQHLEKKEGLNPFGSYENHRECLLLRGKGKNQRSGKALIQLQPEERWIATLNPKEDQLRRETFERFNHDPVKTLTWLAEQYPRGIA